MDNNMKVDYSNRDLRKIEPIQNANLANQIEIAIFDNNSISKLDNLETYSNVKKLSLANNRLVEIRSIIRLQHIQFLNLMNNSLINIDALRDLKQLVWLNISGNEIKNLDALKSNTNLKYIDASDNSISYISNLSTLTELHTLNLNGNIIGTLKPVTQCLPRSIKSFFVAHNVIEDLNEICYLVNLTELECLEFQNNPCVEHKYEIEIDYRPFILNWCENLKILDGSEITKKESLKAEWLYSQGKGRHFRPGQHLLLIEYLAKHCSFNLNESIEDEVRLSKVLEKQKIYQSEIVNKKSTSDIGDTLFATYSTTTTSTTGANTMQTDLNIAPSSSSSNHTISTHNNIKQTAKSIVNIESDSDTELLNSESDFLPFTNTQVSSTVMREKSELEYLSQIISGGKTMPTTTTGGFLLKSPTSPTNSNSKSTAYDEYDSRPIKPLDANSYEKQLSEYIEPSQDQIEVAKLKRAAIQAKAVEHTKVKQQINTMKAIKQQSQAHHSHSNHQQQQQQPHPTHQQESHLVNEHTTSATSMANNAVKHKFKKRSKTIDNIFAHEKANTDKQHSHHQQQQKPVKSSQVSYNPDHYSPKSPSAITSNKKTFTLQTKHNQQPKAEADFIKSNKILKQQKKYNLTNDTNGLSKHSNKSNTNVLNSTLKQTFEDSCATKIQAAWRGYYIRNCSMQVRRKFEILKLKRVLNYLEYLRKNLNELLQQHNQFCKLNYDAFNTLWNMLKNLKMPETSPVQQMASSESNITTNISNPKDHHLMKENIELKQKIKELEERCKTFEQKLMETIVTKQQQNDYLTQLESNSRNSFLTTTETQTSINFATNSYLNENTTTSGTMLTSAEMINSSKIPVDTSEQHQHQPQSQLEQQESPTTTTKEKDKKPTLQPPLRIRLQKVNEKSVVLKWDHNPLNGDLKINGYRIYINNSFRGEVKPNDMRALINGIQEEGEYRINVRAVMDNVESADSNVVITRVKRRTDKPVEHETSNVSSDDAHTNSNSMYKQQSNNSTIPPSSNSSTSAPNTSTTEKKHESVSTTTVPIITTSTATATTNTATSTTTTTITATPIIMDKLKSNNSNLASPSTLNSNAQNSPPKKDKTFNAFVKERLAAEKRNTTNGGDNQFDTENNQYFQLRYQDVASKLGKYVSANPDLLVSDNDKSRSPSKSPESNGNETPNAIPFTHSRLNNLKSNQLANLSSNMYYKSSSRERLDRLSVSPKESTAFVNYKPPVSPPRGPSPTHLNTSGKIIHNLNSNNNKPINSSNTSVGFDVLTNNSQKISTSKHRHSKSVDLNRDSFVNSLNNASTSSDKNKMNNTKEASATSDNEFGHELNNLSVNKSVKTKNIPSPLSIVKSAKYSVSEPNLSVNLAKSEGSGSMSNTKLDLVRRSFAFDDEEEDEDDDGGGGMSSPYDDLVHNKENEQVINIQNTQKLKYKKLREKNKFRKVSDRLIASNNNNNNNNNNQEHNLTSTN